MKVKNLLTVLLWLILIPIYGQVSAYQFNQSSLTYSPITTGTVLGSISNNEEFFVDQFNSSGSTTSTTGIGFPIGFDFTFNNVVYNRFAVHTNGWISLGSTNYFPMVNLGSTNLLQTKIPLSSNTTISPSQLRNRISPLGYDLQGQTGSEIRFQNIGTAPNRILIVQWKNYRSAGQTGQSYNFQIWLLESSNHIYFNYGPMTFSSTFATFNAAAEVGIGGLSNADYNNRSTAFSTDWNITSPGTQVTDSCLLRATIPTSGLLFWYKPSLLSASTFEKQENIKVYPNPTSDCIQIELQELNNNFLNIYNNDGKKVIETKLLEHSNSVNIEKLPKGIYIIELFDGENRFSKKIIKN